MELPTTKLTHSEAATEEVAARFAVNLKPGTLVALVGPLGAGKTVFVRGVVAGLGGEPAKVRSPTFTILNIYTASLPVYHFDFYRVSKGDLDSIGFEDFARGDGVALVEWADRVFDVMVQADYVVSIEYGLSEAERKITLTRRLDA